MMYGISAMRLFETVSETGSMLAPIGMTVYRPLSQGNHFKTADASCRSGNIILFERSNKKIIPILRNLCAMVNSWIVAILHNLGKINQQIRGRRLGSRNHRYPRVGYWIWIMSGFIAFRNRTNRNVLYNRQDLTTLHTVTER